MFNITLRYEFFKYDDLERGHYRDGTPHLGGRLKRLQLEVPSYHITKGSCLGGDSAKILERTGKFLTKTPVVP